MVSSAAAAKQVHKSAAKSSAVIRMGLSGLLVSLILSSLELRNDLVSQRVSSSELLLDRQTRSGMASFFFKRLFLALEFLRGANFFFFLLPALDLEEDFVASAAALALLRGEGVVVAC